MGADLPQWLTTLLTGFGGLGVGGYAVFRRLKADKSNDTLGTKSMVIIERLETQLDSKIKENNHLGEVIDRVAKERNDAVQQVGRLQGTVEALQGEVEHMSREVVKLEKKNVTLTREISALNGTVRNLSEQIQVMLSRFESMGSPDGLG